MRGWLRANAAIAAVVPSARVFFGMPEQDRPATPFIVFYRVGGAPDDKQQDYPSFVIEAWGSTKHEASNLGALIAGEIEESNHRPPVIVDGAKVLAGSVNSGPVQRPGTSWAKRYRIDATFQMRAA
jgi:hypothetical protein